MVRIRLNGGVAAGRSALVDDEDAPSVQHIAWSAVTSRCGTTYAYGWNPAVGRCVLMHQLILPAHEIDHKNRDGLDNRRSNLRIVSRTYNNANATKRKNYAGKPTKSRYKGVRACSNRYRPWQARITLHGKTTYLGCFATEQEAAKAYNAAAIVVFGEFARLNEI